MGQVPDDWDYASAARRTATALNARYGTAECQHTSFEQHGAFIVCSDCDLTFEHVGTRDEPCLRVAEWGRCFRQPV
jgi:hypothetical protein